MAWHRTDDKPLPETMMAQFNDAYERHLASVFFKRPIKLIKPSNMDVLTHWGRVTHICTSDLTSIGSDNGLSPGRRQAIIRTNAGILLIRPLGTNFSEFLVEILMFSFKKTRLKVSSAKRRPFCLGLNELNRTPVSLKWSVKHVSIDTALVIITMAKNVLLSSQGFVYVFLVHCWYHST